MPSSSDCISLSRRTDWSKRSSLGAMLVRTTERTRCVTWMLCVRLTAARTDSGSDCLLGTLNSAGMLKNWLLRYFSRLSVDVGPVEGFKSVLLAQFLNLERTSHLTC